MSVYICSDEAAFFKSVTERAVSRVPALRARHDVSDYLAGLLQNPSLLENFRLIHPIIAREIIHAVRGGDVQVPLSRLRLIGDTYLFTTGMFPELIPPIVSAGDYSDAARFSYDRAHRMTPALIYPPLRNVFETFADCFSDAQLSLSNVRTDIAFGRR